MSSRAILGLRRFDLHIGRWGPGHIFCSGGQKTPNLTGTLLEYTCQPNRIEEVYKWEHHDDQTWCKGRSINNLVRFQEKCRNIFPFYKLCCKFYATIYMKLGRKSFAGFLSMQKCPPKLCQQIVAKKWGHNFTRDQISPPWLYLVLWKYDML